EGDRDQRSLAVLAAVLPDLRLLRALIARGVDLGAAHGGLTPLLAATRDSWHGRPEAVMTLLANGADPRVRDQDGNTPLHHAARSSDPGVAALLRDAAAELEAVNDDGLTPLGSACAAGNWRLARFLLERGARPEIEGATPALVAAAGNDEDDPAGVSLLLKHKARVDTPDARGRTALHEAALAGNIEVARVLLDRGADTGRVDAAGKRAVDHAAEAARWPLVALLDPAYPLPIAGEDDAADLDFDADAEAEAEAEADVEAASSDAAATGPAPPEPVPEPDDRVLASLMARGAESAAAIRELLDRAAQPTGAGGLARFLDACLRGDGAARDLEPLALALLERGADPLGPSPAGDPVLALAVRLDWLRLAARLLAGGVDLAARRRP